ncbi:MAG: class I SAM-dependent methyltransferase [Acidimicrobiales bacterium]
MRRRPRPGQQTDRWPTPSSPSRPRRTPRGTATPPRSPATGPPRPWSTAPSCPPRPSSSSSAPSRAGGLDLAAAPSATPRSSPSRAPRCCAVDPSAEVLGRARERAEAADVRVELHQAGLAELAFLRSDSIDAALSVMALASVDDLARVFRQVHRVLKPEAPLAISMPHPAFALLDPTASDPLRVVGPTTTLRRRGSWMGDVVDHPRTFADLFTTTAAGQLPRRPGDRADGPGHRCRNGAGQADLMRSVPATLLLRARKQGN